MAAGGTANVILRGGPAEGLALQLDIRTQTHVLVPIRHEEEEVPGHWYRRTDTTLPTGERIYEHNGPWQVPAT